MLVLSEVAVKPLGYLGFGVAKISDLLHLLTVSKINNILTFDRSDGMEASQTPG